ncbi:MAG: hypothetical protein JO110_21690, partial [Acetobacteraceae bacterium]|nr:hypothetical protein [Acetobacteraceae bacterium]
MATKPYNGRIEAQHCLERAKRLLANDDSVRYACLELRLCIEHLVFDQLKVYIEETSEHALSKWAPRELISEILAVDPSAEETKPWFVDVKDGHIFSIREESRLDDVPEDRAIPIGEDRRLGVSWVSKRYNVLGNFLHAPNLDQLDK